MADKSISDKQAERIICGCMMLAPEIAANVSLAEQDFFFGDTRSVFAAIVSLARDGHAIDFQAVADRASSRGAKLDPVSDVAKMADEATGYSSRWEGYERRVMDAAIRRRVLAEISVCHDKLLAGDISPAMVARRIEDASAAVAGDVVRDDLGAALQQIEAYQTGTATARRKTGWSEIDKYAPRKNELLVIAGRPSMGKTALSLALAERYLEAGDKVLYLSLEMAPQDLLVRRVCAIAGVSSHKIEEQGALSADEWGRVSGAFDVLHKRSRLHVAFASFDLRGIRIEIERMKARGGVDVVFIDYLGLMRLPEGERYDIRIGEVTRSIAHMAKAENITIVLLHQLNRAPESRESRRPMMSDLRDSGRIEQDADVIWLLYRDSYYDTECADKVIEVMCGKNRNGQTGPAKLYYDPSCCRFAELTKEW